MKPLVLLFLLLLLLLLFLDTKLFQALLKARAPEPVKDPSLSREEQVRADLNRRRKNIEWLNSTECRLATYVPGIPTWYYVRDHYIRKQPWKPNMSA